MSRRCRASLVQGAGGAAGDLSSGCNCGRLSPAPPPCIDPSPIYGANLLPDGGFERQFAEFGGGERGDEFPRAQLFGIGGYKGPFIFGNLEDEGITQDSFWARNDWADPESEDWLISSLNPNQGTFHARRGLPSTTAGFYLMASTFTTCGDKFVTAGAIDEGDLVLWDVAAMIDNDTEGAQITLELGAMNEDFSAFSTAVVKTYDLTTTYQRYGLSTFIHPDSKWLYAWVDVKLPTNPAATRFGDVDTAILTAFQAGTSVLLCAQSNLITVDNSTVETDFL